MSRITKTVANHVATKLAKPKHENYLEKKKELKNIATAVVRKQIPTDVLKVFEKHPDYIGTENHFQFLGPSINFKWIYTEDVPSKNSRVTVDAQDGAILNRLDEQVNKMYQDYKNLLREIEVALLGLGSYKKIEKEFPEAVEFLPKGEITTELSVNINDIRAKL